MSSEVHRLFLKHLEFSTTSKQLADTLTNEGHGDGLVHIRIVRKGSHFPGKTCNAFVTYELESQVRDAVAGLAQSTLNGICKYPCEADVAYPRNNSDTYYHLKENSWTGGPTTSSSTPETPPVTLQPRPPSAPPPASLRPMAPPEPPGLPPGWQAPPGMMFTGPHPFPPPPPLIPFGAPLGPPDGLLPAVAPAAAKVPGATPKADPPWKKTTEKVEKVEKVENKDEESDGQNVTSDGYGEEDLRYGEEDWCDDMLQSSLWEVFHEDDGGKAEGKPEVEAEGKPEVEAEGKPAVKEEGKPEVELVDVKEEATSPAEANQNDEKAVEEAVERVSSAVQKAVGKVVDRSSSDRDRRSKKRPSKKKRKKSRRRSRSRRRRRSSSTSSRSYRSRRRRR